MILPVITVAAVENDKLNMHPIILNKFEVLPEFYVYIPCEIAKWYTPSEIREVTTTAQPSIEFEHISGRRWIDINYDKLNMNPGYHKYRIDFTSTLASKSPIYLFFCYNIQNDDPDKPYIYMNRADSNE